MSCRRCCRCNRLHTDSAELSQGSAVAITVKTVALQDKCYYSLPLYVKFIGATGAENLFIIVDGTSYPVWDRNGEPLKIGRLRCDEVLDLVFISGDTAHFVVQNCLRPLHLKAGN